MYAFNMFVLITVSCTDIPRRWTTWFFIPSQCRYAGDLFIVPTTHKGVCLGSQQGFDIIGR